ncbi:unnamed protein product [Paramecium octaurelia]|uniref:Uncharacterized protein n=1 Tax=Paramecium octaurelia TaxID=43137 RepID=A0A8S1SEG7_PAROT|nr:unnamed protein product [Paramecium octaurelia]
MCFLLVNLEYYITCMTFDLILYEEQTNYKELIRIETKILANEICDELFTNEDQSLSLFCLSQSTLKSYLLDFKRNVTLSLELNVSEQINDECKKTQIKWKENKYLIVFYQCSRWKVILIQDNQVKTIFDAQMMQQDTYLSSLSQIDDVTFCEPNDSTSTLYLIENNFYSKFHKIILHVQVLLNQNGIINSLLVQQKNRIQKIVIQQKCQMIVLVHELNKTDPSKIEAEVRLNQQYPINNIHFHQNLLFFQNQFELNVQINQRINQTYQICNTSLQFFDFANLFCQYDQTKKLIQFYKYQPLSDFIKPKLQFVYVIQKNNLFRRDNVVQCIKILYENNTQKEASQFTEFIKFQNNCQNKQQILWNLTTLTLLIIGWQSTDFQHNCLQRLYKFYQQGKFQLKEITKDYIFFQYEAFFYIYDCKHYQFVVSVSINQYYVLESKSAFYFVNRNYSSYLRGVQFTTDIILNLKIKLKEEITGFKKIYESIFLYTNSSNIPIIILMHSQQNSVHNYLSKNLYQPEPILSYSEFGNSKFIQYAKILIVQNQKQLRMFQFSDSLIISVQAKFSFDCYILVSVQNSTRSLILSYFYDQQLHQIQNYTFQDYSFYYPFKYTINNDNLALLLEQNISLYIAIFQYNLSMLSLNEIIETDDSFFQFDSYRFLFSFDKVWRHLFLKQQFVELKREQPLQNALFSNFSMKIKEEGVQLCISVENQCFELHSLMKSSIIEILNTKSLKLNISQMFNGPISNLTLLNNSNIILKGPFQFLQEISFCKYQTSTICFRKYHLESKSFTVFVQENQIFEVLKNSLLNDYYITWLKQQNYLCVSQLFDILKIDVIECSENEDGDCKIISNLSENFKINQTSIADTIRVGNLLRLSGEMNKAFIFIDDINFNVQMFPDIIIDIQYIEKSNNQYLILQKSREDQNELEFTIYQINLHQKYQIYSLIINQQIIQNY